MKSCCPARRGPVEEVRRVDTPGGPIQYALTRKRVKNLNLRVSREGRVSLSIPQGCPADQGDRLVREKWRWIMDHLDRRREAPDPSPVPTREVCLALLTRALEAVYPLVEPLGVPMPELKLRTMRSQWGNCHWMQGYITLNTALARCPAHLREYVALHELVHFLHHDHGPGFYARMDALMPDWRARRLALREWSGVLVPQKLDKGGTVL